VKTRNECRLHSPFAGTECGCVSVCSADIHGRGERRQAWLGYLEQRTGTYHYRTRRYAAVCVELERLGLRGGDLLYDVGAGQCEFGKYLYGSGWTGRYVAVDGAIDGTELERWSPPLPADWLVALELVEHLRHPLVFLAMLEGLSTRGAVITTPNPEVVDVLALDETHLSAIPAEMLRTRGWEVRADALFGKPRDTLIGTWRGKGNPVA
jgi:hypothetical protein